MRLPHIALACLLCLSTTTIAAATFTVTTTAGLGAGSLREAVDAANAAAGADTIVFAIPGNGPHRLQPSGLGFGIVTEALTIDGYTQPGAAPNTLAEGSNAVILIELDGNGSGAGLRVCGGPTLVRGLSLSGFIGDDLGVQSTCPNPGAVTVRGNFIGLRADGVSKPGITGGLGVSIPGAIIGGSQPADRNLIAGFFAIDVNAVGAVIDGNIIGGDRHGRPLVLSSGTVGIRVNGPAAADQTLIGTQRANRLMGSTTGIAVLQSANRVNMGNNDFEDLGGLGIDLASGSTTDGITANDPDDADSGSNNLQNHPLPTAATRSASGISISGTLDRPAGNVFMSYTISAFASRSCDSATHRSGEIALGSLTFASGNGSVESFSGNIASARSIPFGAFITLTATDNQGNSSEFSPCLALTEPAPFVVSKTADTSDGACNADCSLREAIIAANAQAGADRIHFNIPGGGVQSIAPTSPLPALTGQTLIDGYTQPGAAVNTATTLPGNAQLRIELNGVAAGAAATGLVLQGAQSVVRGLVINRFDSASVSVQAASVAVQGCILGTDAAASVRHAHANAVVVAAGASNALIGGNLPAQSNLIAGGQTSGVVAREAGARILGNEIGRPSLSNAIGVQTIVPSTSKAPVLVGDGTPEGANLIRGNNVGVKHSAVGFAPLSVRHNSILASAFLGIDLGAGGVTANDPDDIDTGPNGLQNFPELQRAVVDGAFVEVDFRLDVPTTPRELPYTFEFYRSATCDSSGNGEGEDHLLTLTINLGGISGEQRQASIALADLPLGSVVTATATDPEGNTSEFSQCVTVQAQQIFANGLE